MIERALTEKLKALNESLWNRRLNLPQINAWLDNFQKPTGTNGDERLHALFLLSHFTFFNSQLMRVLLHASFRDHIKYPLVVGIRKRLSDTVDATVIASAFAKELEALRFIGVGNPSDSGGHLLYYFRQENSLPGHLFASGHECIAKQASTSQGIQSGAIKQLVFLDDFCGSGTTAGRYYKELVAAIKNLRSDVIVHYHVLFATAEGLKRVRDAKEYDAVSCVCELDASFKCFSDESRYFRDLPLPITQTFAHAMCTKYGTAIEPKSPLGFGDCQLLLGFEHNIPNNTLPIIWSEGHGSHRWAPAFRRYRKGENW